MGTLIKYRDLPGGPKEIKFADEINRTCLCGKCGMLSTSMYRDPADHIFCEACLRAQSKQHGQSDIYCEYECRFIDINEMEEAFDLVTMLRDQYVQCPNRQRCGSQVHFQDLKKHYIECQPEVPCSTCGSQVVSKDWEEHKNACSLTDKDKGPSKKSLTSRQAEQNPSSPCSLKQDVPLAGNTTKFQNSSALTSHLYPFDKLNEVAESTAGLVEDDNVEPASKAARLTSQARPEASGSHTVKCPYCQRKVKDTNMNVHLKRCPKSPIYCGYCSTFICKEDKTIHEEMCKSNAKKSMAAQSFQTEDFPPLQPERADGGKEEPATSGKNTHSSGSKANAWSSKQGSISKQRGSGSNLPQSKGSKKETPAQRETVTTDKPGNETKKKGTRDAADDPDEHSAIARPNYNAHSAYSPASDSSFRDRSEITEERGRGCCESFIRGFVTCCGFFSG